MRVLLISNLNLKLIQWATHFLDGAKALVESEKPQLIIIVGNISQHEKRSILFAEEVAASTGLPVLYNIGIHEYSSMAEMNYYRDAMKFRLRANDKKTNVWWCEDWKSDTHQFRHVMGWPVLDTTQEALSLTIPGRFLIKNRDELWLGGELVSWSYPRAFTVEDYRESMNSEPNPDWEEGKTRILLSAFAPEHDPMLPIPHSKGKSYGEDLRLGTNSAQFVVRDI